MRARRDRVEAGERLVDEQDRRPLDDRARERHALHHAARELARQQRVDVVEPDRRQAIVHLVGDLGLSELACARAAGSARLSKTVIESSSAPPWNIMPSLRAHPVERALGEPRDVVAVDDDAARPAAARARRSSAASCSSPSRCRRGCTTRAPAGTGTTGRGRPDGSPNAIVTCESSTWGSRTTSPPYFTTRSTISMTSSVWTSLLEVLRLDAVRQHRHAERTRDGDDLGVRLAAPGRCAAGSRACPDPPRSTCARRRRRSTCRSGLWRVHLARRCGAGLREHLARLVVHLVEAAVVAGVVVGGLASEARAGTCELARRRSAAARSSAAWITS